MWVQFYLVKTIFFVAMNKRIIFILIFCVSFAHAQMLDNTEGKTFGDVPFFNTEFVKRNKIKSIKGFYSTKATLDYIRKTKDIYFYEFNTKGQLTKDFRTQYGDTLVSMYEYDDKGRLQLMRKSDKGGFHAYHYTYDDQDRVLEEEYRRDVSKVGDKTKFQLDRTFVVSIEKYAYEDLEGGHYKKIYFNSAGKVYKEEFFYKNEFGNLARQEGRLKMGSGLTNTTYTYDEKGRVIEKMVEKKVMGNYVSKWVYEYDTHDNVLAQHYYKDDKYITEIQIVYSDATMLLEAIISRDEETNFVTILQFSDVTFYD